MKHEEFIPHAILTLSNTGGIQLMVNNSCDAVYYRFITDEDSIKTAEIFEAEIRYSDEEDSRAYFVHGVEGRTDTTEYNLSDFLKINR